jgi:hypothetical protein
MAPVIQAIQSDGGQNTVYIFNITATRLGKILGKIFEFNGLI